VEAPQDTSFDAGAAGGAGEGERREEYVRHGSAGCSEVQEGGQQAGGVGGGRGGAGVDNGRREIVEMLRPEMLEIMAEVRSLIDECGVRTQGVRDRHTRDTLVVTRNRPPLSFIGFFLRTVCLY
jgi:hypothetical protein